MAAFRLVLLVVALAFIPALVRAQCAEAPIDSIELRMDACLDNDSAFTTYGMMACVGAARDAWETEMSLYLQLLTDSLPYPQKLELVASQTAWVEYHEKAKAWSGLLYYELMQGTMWRVTAVYDDLEMVRNRSLQLRDQYCHYMLGAEK